jgi:prepilin-type N-terminal cleavage/methylation domain-containing protein
MHLSTPPASLRETGFTLLEVLIAMLLVASVAMGVAQLFALTMIATENSRHETSSTALAVQKMEELRGLTWSFAAGGAVSDVSTNLSTDPATTAGPGLSVSPAGTLSTSTPGYVDYLDDRGRWVGTGTALPSGVVYIRRWSIEALQSDPDTLVFQVLVTTVRRDREAAAAGGNRQRRRGDALLTSVRTRKAAHS